MEVAHRIFRILDNVKYQHKDGRELLRSLDDFLESWTTTEMSLSFYLEQMELSVSLYFY